MKISNFKLVILSLICLTSQPTWADSETAFNDFTAKKLASILAEPRFQSLTAEEKERLGSCLKRKFEKCMTQNCYYCPGDGSCAKCDKPKPCSTCSVGCKLTPDGRGADFCAEACGTTSASHCWF